MSKQKIVKVKIQRFDPSTDGKPYYQTFEVPIPEQKHLIVSLGESTRFSVSDALEYIYENLDPSLAYYYTCRYGSCRGCECIVNGQARIACHTLIEESKEIVVEPLLGYEIIRDLVVDTSKIPKGKRRQYKMRKNKF